VEEATEEVWWIIPLRRSPLGGGEHGRVDEKRKVKLFERCRRLYLQWSENLLERIVSGKAELVLDTSDLSYPPL